MSPGILGKKIGMSQVFRPDGQAVPVTLLKAGPCMVVQRKTPTTDGYDAVQLGLVALMIIAPANSPWAPAAGCNDTLSNPTISASHLESSWSILRMPCTDPTSCNGCKSWILWEATILSSTLGLYFIVQLPSG